MTTPTPESVKALADLADRVESATGNDRDLILEAWALVFPAPESGWRPGVGFNSDWHAWNRRQAKVGNWTAAGAYLDAAMTLIGSDAYWRLGNDGEGADVSAFKATVTSGDGPSLAFHDAVAATPALALTAAALRVRAHIGASHE